MATHAGSKLLIQTGTESVTVWTGHSASAAVLAEPRAYRLEPTPTQAAAPASSGALASIRRELSKEQAATWIRVLLRLEPELPMARLADELGLSDRQLGMGLAMLIREGEANICRAPARLRVVRAETAGRQAS